MCMYITGAEQIKAECIGIDKYLQNVQSDTVTKRYNLRHSPRSKSMNMEVDDNMNMGVDNTNVASTSTGVGDIRDKENVIINAEIGEMEDETEFYKGLKNRMKWSNIIQNSKSKMHIPAWTGTVVTGDVLEPIDYFYKLFDNDVMEMICKESNRYALQCGINNQLCLSTEDLERFMGCGIYMSLVRLPWVRMYWSPETQISAITDCLTRRRFDAIKRFLHFSDNEKAPERESFFFDKLYKVRPLIELINNNFQTIPLSEHLSVDEMMVPYTGTRGPRYYVKLKPNP